MSQKAPSWLALIRRAAATVLAALTLPIAADGANGSSALLKLQKLEEAGKFQEADSVAAASLVDLSLPESTRRQFEFERERLRRIRQDYALPLDQLEAAVRAAVRGLTDAEFNAWVKQGRFDGRRIDGSIRYLKVSVSNLFFRYPELEARRLRPRGSPVLAKAMWTNAMSIRDAARTEGRPYVLPKHIAVRMVVRLQPDSWDGFDETVMARAWLPIPRQLPFQDNLRIVRSEPNRHTLAPPDSPIRSIYFERMLAPHATDDVEFAVEYAYRAHGVWFDLAPGKSQPASADETEPARFLAQAPHVEFTPALRRLSRQLTGSETNLVRRAKRYYDWIAGHIRYSFAPEYSTIRNLGEFCRSHSYGDCGMEAFLFITLCRMNGIPARWQSGWSIFPGAETIHDWCEIHLAPWGWVPVDPYLGIYATQYATALTPQQRQELNDFYFGGLTQYRMIANSDHSQPLFPAKNSFRSDDVDFQRGEVEVAGRNVYFNQQTYDFRVRSSELGVD